MKTLLADDHPLMREGVRQVLAQLDTAVDIIDAHDYPSLFAQTALHQDLDLALVDLNMPGLVGMQGISQFRQLFPHIPLVVLSASESPHDIRNALEAGALGYIPKASGSSTMLDALRQVLAGDLYTPQSLLEPDERVRVPTLPDTVLDAMTGRQRDVARLLGHGFTNKAIGTMLGMTENTVKVHVAAIFRVLGVTNRTEAVLVMQRLSPP